MVAYLLNGLVFHQSVFSQVVHLINALMCSKFGVIRTCIDGDIFAQSISTNSPIAQQQG